MENKFIDEQKGYHFKEGSETERDRTLRDYCVSFNIDNNVLDRKILEFSNSREGCVFADYACGDGVALREAKALAKKYGVGNKVKTFGIDAFLPDEQKIKDRIRDFPKDYSPNLVMPEFRPTFYEADIETVRLPEKTDIATIAEALYYTRNPLKVVVNILSQSKKGGLIFINGLTRLRLTDSPDIRGRSLGKLFGDYFVKSRNKIQGYKILNVDNGIRTIFGPDSIVIQKESKEDDPKKVEKELGFDKYKLIDRVESKSMGGLIYYYWK